MLAPGSPSKLDFAFFSGGYVSNLCDTSGVAAQQSKLVSNPNKNQKNRDAKFTSSRRE